MAKGDTSIKHLKLDGSIGTSTGMSYKSSLPFWLHIQSKENISRIKNRAISVSSNVQKVLYSLSFLREKSSTSATIQKIPANWKEFFLDKPLLSYYDTYKNFPYKEFHHA